MQSVRVEQLKQSVQAIQHRVFLHLSYICREMAIPLAFPKLFILQIDNAAAKVFAEGTHKRTKMKHIDCSHGQVFIPGDRSVLIPVHVGSKENLGDIFIKILDVPTFLIFEIQTNVWAPIMMHLELKKAMANINGPS